MKARKEDTAMVLKILRPVLWGTVFGALICLLLLFVMAAILTANNVPQAAVTPMAIVAAAIGAFLGGLIAARIAREKGLLIGALTGLLLFVIMAIAGFIFVQDVRGSYAILKAAIFLACGAVGGIVGVNLQRRR